MTVKPFEITRQVLTAPFNRLARLGPGIALVTGAISGWALHKIRAGGRLGTSFLWQTNLLEPIHPTTEIMRQYHSYLHAEINEEMYEYDDMFVKGHLEHYLSVGQSAMKIIVSSMILAEKTQINSVLDLPCGGGRVTRHFVALFPDSRIYVSDINKSKEDFVVRTFGATQINVSDDFASAPEQEFDLIFVGSLVTHFDVEYFKNSMNWFIKALAPNGLLVVTTHGRRAAHIQAGLFRSVGWETMLDDYEKSGFGHKLLGDPSGQYGKTPYGGSLSAPSWVMHLSERIPDIRILGFQEGAWDDHQDVLVLQKRSLFC